MQGSQTSTWIDSSLLSKQMTQGFPKAADPRRLQRTHWITARNLCARPGVCRLASMNFLPPSRPGQEWSGLPTGSVERQRSFPSRPIQSNPIQSCRWFQRNDQARTCLARRSRLDPVLRSAPLRRSRPQATASRVRAAGAGPTQLER